ncbi:hypothetical protein KP79_PYT24297 [Mizuhopecten yessoensis]|uniref:C-type lectin domain-containing protein n=1 Tax=Mizuhopecten yessoensis TaxID=6573 RepID=A0A210Q5V6_MIZYE|nr:hypothetical protein KP79_PYT24297 [Mizuhopecten yessoensis]
MSYLTMYMCILFHMSMECSGLYVNHVSDPTTNREARRTCELVRPLDQNSRNILLEISNSLAPVPKLAWVNGYVAFTNWIEFKGCIPVDLSTIQSNLQRIPNGSNDVILFCYRRCYPSTFALYDDNCVCIDPNFRRGNRTFCQDVMLMDGIGIIGVKRHNVNACICTYSPRHENASTLTENIGYGQCLNLQHNYSNHPSIQSSNCNAKRYYFCYINQTSSYTFNSNMEQKKTFWESAMHCQNLSTYFALNYSDNLAVTLSSVVLWGSSFRRYTLHLNISDNVSSVYCAAVAPEADGSFEIVPRPCTDRLPGFCSNDANLSTVVVVFISLCVAIATCSCFTILFFRFFKRYTLNIFETKAEDVHPKTIMTKNRPEIELYVFNEVCDTPQVESSGVYNVLHQRNTSDTKSRPELYDHIPGGAANGRSDDNYDLICGQGKSIERSVESTDYDSVKYRPEMDNAHLKRHYDNFELQNDKQKTQMFSEYDHVDHILTEK